MAETVQGTYNLTPVTLNSGEDENFQVDINSFLLVNQGTLQAGEDLSVTPYGVMITEQRYSYSNISTATTTTVKSGSGFFHALVINTPVASSVITIYDNTAGSGTKIGTITLPAVLLQEGPNPAIYNVSFGTGLTIVTATGASDITVSYR